MYLYMFPLSLRQNCPYIDAKEIRLVDRIKTLVIETLSSLRMFFVHIFTCNCPCVGIRSVIYYACLNTIKYYTVQVTNLYTDASDSQDNDNQVYLTLQDFSHTEILNCCIRSSSLQIM